MDYTWSDKRIYPSNIRVCASIVATGWIWSWRTDIVVELKTVDKIHPIHQTQMITYLKLSGYRVGLIMNFKVGHFREGLRRIVH